MTITEKVAFLKGLLEGMNIDPNTNEGKLWKAVMDVLADLALSVEDLEDAMIHPEKHQNIVVKVTGYSAHFIQLDKTFQREIINRTRHTRM